VGFFYWPLRETTAAIEVGLRPAVLKDDLLDAGQWQVRAIPANVKLVTLRHQPAKESAASASPAAGPCALVAERLTAADVDQTSTAKPGTTPNASAADLDLASRQSQPAKVDRGRDFSV